MNKINNIIISIFIFCSTLFSQELEKVTLQLNWKYQFEFAGFIAAKEKGFYSDAGLDVDILEYNSSINVIKDVKDLKVDFGVYDLSIGEFYDKDKPLVLLANYLKRSALVFIAKQDIITPYDFENRSIMVEKEQLERSVLNDLIKKFNINNDSFSKVVPHNYSADDFINGKVDIISAYLSNELYHIKKSKVPYNLIDPSNFGLNNFSLNIFALKDEVRKDPKKVKKFIDATNKGWEYAFSNKNEIVDIIYEKYSKMKTKEALRFESKEIEKLMLLNFYDIGSINEDLVNELLVKLKEYDKTLKVSTNDIIFNPYLNKDGDILSSEDRKYLSSKKEVKVCIDPNWFPFEKIEEGKHIGISKDYMSIFEKKLNIPLNLYPTKNWNETLKSLESKECDIISMAAKTASREKFANFTKPYLSTSIVIATKTNELFIADPKEIIQKKKLAVVKGYATKDILLRNGYVFKNLIEVSSVNEGLEKVRQGEVFGFIDILPAIAYEIQSNFLSEIQISGKLNETFDLSIAIRNDDKELLKIFDKLILDLEQELKHEIFSKWINIKYEQGIDYSIVWKVVLAFILISLFFFYRHREVLKHNSKILEQQEKLKVKNNELLETQRNLQITLKKFETLLSSTMDSILVVQKGKLLDVNENAIRLLGFDNIDEVIGSEIVDFLLEEDRKILFRKSYKNQEPFEMYLKTKDGVQIPCLVKISTTKFEKKYVYIASVIDLREIKQKEKLFFKQSKMASMGEMIGNIAHQWRQPLSVISAVSSGIKLKLMLGDLDKNDAVVSLDNLNDSAQYLSQTIDDFRNFYKTDKEKSYISSKVIVDKNINLLESALKASGIKLFVNNTCEDIEVYTYINELIQATVNILNNAKDALENKDEQSRFVFFNVYEEEEFVVLSIKDTAGGIPEDIIDKIFEPYFTTKHKSNGTGIGLYMTHQIIENHINGKIDVQNVEFEYENKTYKGVNFLIYIPRF